MEIFEIKLKGNKEMISPLRSKYLLYRNIALFAGIDLKTSGSLPEQTYNISFDSFICGICGVVSENSCLSRSGKYVIAIHSHQQKLFYVKYTKRVDYVKLILRNIDDCLSDKENPNISKVNEILESEGFLEISPVYFGDLEPGEKPGFGKISEKK